MNGDIMMQLKMPDGSMRDFDDGLNGYEVSRTISTSLAKKAIAIKVNGELKDLSDEVENGAAIQIITVDDAEGLEIMRHTVTAQVLARAVKNLYPSAKLAIGPTIDDGFYYDVELDKPLSEEDLEAIEEEMRNIVSSKSEIEKKYYTKAEAIALFKERGEEYKIEIIEGSGQDENLQIYHQGDTGFIDLCRGPHLNSLALVGAFKLLKVSGAYWRGDSNNKMLTRIYGTAWKDQKALDAYLNRLEEAERRDHRKIGKIMNLFHFQDEAPGQVFWHHNGWTIYTALMEFMREKIKKYDYIEVNTPQMLDSRFWKASGHWDKYQDNMFVIDDEEGSRENPFALKPMSCPGNAQLYNSDLRSYRDLPLRMAEFGHVFRQEASGARHGLMRVQAFTQDDAHIFCTDEQLEDEVVLMCDLIKEAYTDLGLADDITINFSTRPEMRIGSDEDWDRAEAALQKVLDRIGMKWQLNEGDGAFYAPKLDFILTDAIGRTWQCGTIQVDMNMPNRLNMTYTGEDGQKHTPHMIHRAIFGSIERFIGVMIEHYAGNFPLWLSPTQLVITGIRSDHNEYAEEIYAMFKKEGIRVKFDDRNEKVNYKVRDHMSKKVTYVGVVGDKEVEDRTITVRRLGVNKQKTYSIEEFRDMMVEEIKTRALPPKTEE